jgi:hypothetical protein
MYCSSEGMCVPGLTLPDASAGDASAFACADLPAPAVDPSQQLSLSMRYTDYSAGTPPANAMARLCAATDSTCANARALDGAGVADAGAEGGAGWVKMRADGTVSAKVERGFEGFFEARSVEYLPTFRSTSPPLRNPTNVLEQLLLRPLEVRQLAINIGAKAFDETTHGLVFVLARDCNEQPLKGASFTTSAIDPQMQLFYVINATPSITDTQTDTFGRGGFINVPPGFHTFTVFLGEGAAKKRMGAGRVLVRAGAATTIAVSPSQ